MALTKIFLSTIMAFAIAIPVSMVSNISTADARHKHHKRSTGAFIAGAIIGGAIIYKHHKRKKYHSKHRRKSYGHSYRSGYGYGQRRHKVRRHKVRRHHGYRYGGYKSRRIK